MAVLSSIFGRGTPTPQVPGRVISTENIPKSFKNFGKSFVIENKCCFPNSGSICACIITILEF